MLRLPPCPAFFCSPILVPSPLFRFATFAEHCHTAAYPRSPAVLFLSSCPAAFALFIGRRVPASNLVRLAAVLFNRRFPYLLASYTAFQSAFLSAFCPRFSVPFYIFPFFQCPLFITLFPKTYLPPCCACRRAPSFLPSSSSISYRFYQILPALLPASPAFLIFDVRSISTCFYKPLFPGIPAKIPRRASFLRTKKPALPPVLFFLYKLFLYALAFSISSPACSMPWPLSPSPPSSLATSFCRAVSSRRCTRVRVSSFSTVFSIR